MKLKFVPPSIDSLQINGERVDNKESLIQSYLTDDLLQSNWDDINKARNEGDWLAGILLLLGLSRLGLLVKSDELMIAEIRMQLAQFVRSESPLEAYMLYAANFKSLYPDATVDELGLVDRMEKLLEFRRDYVSIMYFPGVATAVIEDFMAFMILLPDTDPSQLLSDTVYADAISYLNGMSLPDHFLQVAQALFSLLVLSPDRLPQCILYRNIMLEAPELLSAWVNLNPGKLNELTALLIYLRALLADEFDYFPWYIRFMAEQDPHELPTNPIFNADK